MQKQRKDANKNGKMLEELVVEIKIHIINKILKVFFIGLPP